MNKSACFLPQTNRYGAIFHFPYQFTSYKGASVSQYGWTTTEAELTVAPVSDAVFIYTHDSNGLDSADRTLGTGNDAIKYLGSYKTGGTSQAKRNIKIEIPTGKTATFSAVVSANKNGDMYFFIGTSISSSTPTSGTYVKTSSTSDLQKISTVLSAGTYYLNFTAAGRIYELLAELQ